MMEEIQDYEKYLFLLAGILFIIINSYIITSPRTYLNYIRKKRHQAKEIPEHLFAVDIQTTRNFAIACLIFSIIWTSLVLWKLFMASSP